MQYVTLIYTAPGSGPAWGTPEFDKMLSDYMTLGERMKDRAKVLAGEGLKGVDTATSFRIRGGKTEVMDGPFADTREHLGGFYLIEVAHLDDALAFAAAIPGAAWGTVELRPVMDY